MREFFLIYDGAVAGFALALLFMRISMERRKCEHCKKRYWRKNSTSKYPAIFCSMWCNSCNLVDYLVKEGWSHEVAIEMVVKDDLKSDKNL